MGRFAFSFGINTLSLKSAHHTIVPEGDYTIKVKSHTITVSFLTNKNVMSSMVGDLLAPPRALTLLPSTQKQTNTHEVETLLCVLESLGLGPSNQHTHSH